MMILLGAAGQETWRARALNQHHTGITYPRPARRNTQFVRFYAYMVGSPAVRRL